MTSTSQATGIRSRTVGIPNASHWVKLMVSVVVLLHEADDERFVAPIFLLRDLGPLPGTSLDHTVWRKGLRLVVFGTGRPITAAEFNSPGSIISVVEVFWTHMLMKPVAHIMPSTSPCALPPARATMA